MFKESGLTPLAFAWNPYMKRAFAQKRIAQKAAEKKNIASIKAAVEKKT